jgi:hypothetical protein
MKGIANENPDCHGAGEKENARSGPAMPSPGDPKAEPMICVFGDFPKIFLLALQLN